MNYQKIANVLLLMVFAFVLRADTVMVPRFRSVKLVHDGVADEDFWKEAALIRDFQIFRKGGRSGAATELRICADKKNIYLALRCEEPSGKISALQDSSVWGSDNADIFFASTAEGNEWVRQLTVGCNGKRYTEFIGEERFFPVLKLEKAQWTAEIVIPWAEMGALENGTLRFNMLRNRKAAGEISTWQNVWYGIDTDMFGTLKFFTPATEVMHGPWSSEVSANSGIISFETYGKCAASVFFREFGTEKFTEVFADISGGVRNRDRRLHHAKLNNLKPDTRYEYHTGDGKVHSFRTLTEKSDEFRFTVVSDIHGNSKKLENILSRNDIQSSDMMFLLGDLVTGVIGRNMCYDGFLDVLAQYWNKPFYVTRGNHEYRGGAPGEFFNMFVPEEGRFYRAFNHKGVFFVILDTDGDVVHDRSYMEAQAEWLKRTVESEAFINAEYRVLLNHVPLLPEDLGGRNEILKLFFSLPEARRNAFDLALSGHLHRMEKLLPGADKIVSNIPSRNGKKVDGKFKLAFPAVTTDFCGAITVDKNSRALELRIYDRDGKLYDTLEVARGAQ